MSTSFLIFFGYARPISVQTKVHFKKLQFLLVTFDMGVYVVISTLSKRQCCFHLFKQFLETEMTWSQRTVVRVCIFTNQNLCLRHVKG